MLEPPNNITARSSLRHRPIRSADATTEDAPLVPRASRAHPSAPPQTPFQGPFSQRVRPTEPLSSPMGATPDSGDLPDDARRTSRLPRQKKTLRRQRHMLVFLGLGMILALICVFTFQSVRSWLATSWDDSHYGRPRTFQADMYVGHETGKTPSHFIALNLHGRIEVIELPGGDQTHPQVYLGPQLYGPDADLIPVTLQFVDPNKTGHPDMVVHFQDVSIVFRNEKGKFRPT